MILFWQEVKECYTSATYLHEKAFRDCGSGFKDYRPIDYGTTRARPEHRETKP